MCSLSLDGLIFKFLVDQTSVNIGSCQKLLRTSSRRRWDLQHNHSPSSSTNCISCTPCLQSFQRHSWYWHQKHYPDIIFNLFALLSHLRNHYLQSKLWDNWDYPIIPLSGSPDLLSGALTSETLCISKTMHHDRLHRHLVQRPRVSATLEVDQPLQAGLDINVLKIFSSLIKVNRN